MKAGDSCRERLPDFFDDFGHERTRKVRKNVSPSDIRHWFRGGRSFEQSQLESFPLQNKSGVQLHQVGNRSWNPSETIRKFGALPLISHSEEPVLCPKCGRLDIIGHGLGESKVLRNPSSRWKCNCCGHTFRWDVAKGLKFPLPLWDVVITSFLAGVSFRKMSVTVSEKASDLELPVNSISSDAVYSIVKRSCQILRPFEKFAVRNLVEQEIKLRTMQIDFTPYTLFIPERGGRQLTLRMKPVKLSNLSDDQVKRLRISKPVVTYLTGIIDEESRYPTSVVTGWGFNHKYSLRCLRETLEIFGGKPEAIKCDGCKGHVKAVKTFLPDVKLTSRTKKQDYAIVNHIESFWGKLKTEFLHDYRFRSFDTLSYGVELKRHEYIWLRPHTGLNGRTPAEFLQIRIPKSILKGKGGKWQEFLRFAHRMVMIEEAVNEKERKSEVPKSIDP